MFTVLLAVCEVLMLMCAVFPTVVFISVLAELWGVGGVFSVRPVFTAERLGSAPYKATVQDRCYVRCKELLRKKWAHLHFSVGA